MACGCRSLVTFRGARAEGCHRTARLDGFNRNCQPRHSRRAGRPLFPSAARCRLPRTSSWKEVGARVRRAPLARNLARGWRRVLALARSCGTPWNSADNANAFAQSQLATAWLAGAISPPNLFHPWRRGHRRTRLRCRHPRRPRTRRCRSASQSCGSPSQLGASTPPLDLVDCPDSPGNRPHPAAFILSGNPRVTTCAKGSPSTRATACLAEPST